MKVIAGVYSGVTTVELDTLAAETAAAMTTKHPDYAILAARIAVSNLHKETQKLFSGTYSEFYSVCMTITFLQLSLPSPLPSLSHSHTHHSCDGKAVQICTPHYKETLPNDLKGYIRHYHKECRCMPLVY